MNSWAAAPLRHLKATAVMLKNGIRGGLGIPSAWATMRGQAKKRMSLPMRKKSFPAGKKDRTTSAYPFPISLTE